MLKEHGHSRPESLRIVATHAFRPSVWIFRDPQSLFSSGDAAILPDPLEEVSSAEANGTTDNPRPSPNDTEDRACQRALPTTGGAGDAEDFPRVQLEAHPVDRPPDAVIGREEGVQILNLKADLSL
jgi:hypothetical protein